MAENKPRLCLVNTQTNYSTSFCISFWAPNSYLPTKLCKNHCSWLKNTACNSSSPNYSKFMESTASKPSSGLLYINHDKIIRRVWICTNSSAFLSLLIVHFDLYIVNNTAHSSKIAWKNLQSKYPTALLTKK